MSRKTNIKHKDAELIFDDSLSALKKIDSNSIDMVFADPPYNLSNGGITVQSGRMVSVNKGAWDVSKGHSEDFAFHSSWIKEVQRVLKEHGTMWVSGTYHSIYHCGYAIQQAEMKVLNEISWFKPNASPNLSCRYFTASHETLIWAGKTSKSKHTFNYKSMKYGDWPEDKLKNPDKQMRSVWSIPSPSKSEKLHGRHPTQKPLKLLRRIIEASSNSGDLILDPFTGSSTTGVAALELGRRFIGIDNNKDYIDLSLRRIKGHYETA